MKILELFASKFSPVTARGSAGREVQDANDALPLAWRVTV
jgi:hypothetical protein